MCLCGGYMCVGVWDVCIGNVLGVCGVVCAFTFDY